MKTRILTALVVIVICVPPVILGGWLLELLAILILAGSCFEWLHVQKNFTQWPIWVFPSCLGLTFLSRFVPTNYLFAFLIACVVYFWSLNLFVETFTIDNAFNMISFFVIFFLVYRSIALIQQNHLYLITIVFATYGSDTGAWFFGRQFGRHKMNPRISPKKSWEGFVGGIVTGFILGWLPTFLYLGQVDLALVFLLSLICPVMAEFGDLCFSSVKRYFGVKDFSHLLPGHGGVLDRVDSLLMNILCFGVLSVFFVL